MASKSIRFNPLILVSNKAIPLILMILMVLIMMIIPLPTWFLDLVILFNIAISILVLMVVVYMGSPVGLTSFPSILLVLAVFRIGITVSTSRLILLEGDAGHTVETFGDFVAGGNLVVGMIIFTIVTVINFIVITKGAERVAEVAARFSLDAMPGKQMSIDNDLKSGNITAEEANERRSVLDQLSKLYGAMDGAMKFVKGDAIASIIDILVNLIGGIIIGIMFQNMSAGDSAHKYSILTIGDGLVQQIPAILVSLTAGMMITKVNSDKLSNLGEDIVSQVFADFRPVSVAAVFTIMLTLIPGMPGLELSVLGLAFGGIAVMLYLKSKKGDAGKNGQIRTLKETEAPAPLKAADSVLAIPILLYIPNEINGSALDQLKAVLQQMKAELFQDIGVTLPEIIIKYNSSLADDKLEFNIYEIPVAIITTHPGKLLCIGSEYQLDQLNLPEEELSRNKVYFGSRYLGAWAEMKHKEKLQAVDMKFIEYPEFLKLAFTAAIYENLDQIFSMNEVRILFSDIKEFRDLSNELLRMLPLNKITQIVQRLLLERISLRNFKVILSTLLEAAQVEKDIVVLTESVRKSLSKYMVHKFTKDGHLDCIIIANDMQDLLRDSIIYNNDMMMLEVSPELEGQFIYQVEQIISENPAIENISLLTTLDLRPHVKQLITSSLPFMQVLSYQELGDKININNLGFVSLET